MWLALVHSRAPLKPSLNPKPALSPTGKASLHTSWFPALTLKNLLPFMDESSPLQASLFFLWFLLLLSGIYMQHKIKPIWFTPSNPLPPTDGVRSLGSLSAAPEELYGHWNLVGLQREYPQNPNQPGCHSNAHSKLRCMCPSVDRFLEEPGNRQSHRDPSESVGLLL